jgi:mRNA interferase MazF
MTTSKTYQQGDIVLVPFPFTDQTTTKQRTALVVSSNWYNQLRTDCIMAQITSTIHVKPDRDEVKIEGQEAMDAGLLHDSTIKVGNMFTIERADIKKSLGRLPRGIYKKVMDTINLVFFGKI